jgi:hypothetical protein
VLGGGDTLALDTIDITVAVADLYDGSGVTARRPPPLL